MPRDSSYDHFLADNKCNCPGITASRVWPGWDGKIDPYSTRNAPKAGILVVSGKTVALSQCCGNYWSIQKGGVHNKIGETSVEAAIRESKEDSGMEFTQERLESAKCLDIGSCKIYVIYADSPPKVPLNDTIAQEITGQAWVCRNCIKQLTSKGGGKCGRHALNPVTRNALEQIGFLPKL